MPSEVRMGGNADILAGSKCNEESVRAFKQSWEG